jgi:hypothetical protein
MQLPRHFALAGLTAALAGCALLGFGPPTGIVEGQVFSAGSGAPIPHAEVCVFGMDTTCVRADSRGQYRVRLPEQIIVLRFRAGQLPPAGSDTLHVTLASRITVDCGISERLVITDRLLPCQPRPGR